MEKGFFITIEACEGGGKSELVRRLGEHFKKHNVDFLVTREPGGSAFGMKVRELLFNPTYNLPPISDFFLFLADRAEHVENTIKPALLHGKIVICDRFSLSTLAIQGTSIGNVGMLRTVEAISRGGLFPDLTLVLDIEPSIGLRRKTEMGEVQKFELKDLNFHEEVRESLLQFAEDDPGTIKVIDASVDKDQVFHDALRHIQLQMGDRFKEFIKAAA